MGPSVSWDPWPRPVARAGDARVYTDWRKWALDAGLGHLCTLLRRDSPRQRPAQTPEEPILRGIYSWLRGLGLDRIALRGKVQAKVGGEQPSRRGLPNGSHPPRTRVAKACPAEVCIMGRGVRGPRDGGGCPLQPECLELLSGLLDLYLDLLGVLADNGLEAK